MKHSLLKAGLTAVLMLSAMTLLRSSSAFKIVLLTNLLLYFGIRVRVAKQGYIGNISPIVVAVYNIILRVSKRNSV